MADLEDIGFGALREAQLVDVHVCAKGDQAHLSVLGQGLQGLCEGCSAGRQLVFCHAGVDDEDVGRRGYDLGGGGLVLNCLVLLEELRRLILQKERGT